MRTRSRVPYREHVLGGVHAQPVRLGAEARVDEGNHCRRPGRLLSRRVGPNLSQGRSIFALRCSDRREVRTVSLFSGVGGLESEEPAEVLCEIDADCRIVLGRRFADARLHDDVNSLRPIAGIDAVFGGWPCQDVSVAGLRKGLAGERSGLLFRMIDFAQASGAATIVAENVPNLLKVEGGENFRLTLAALENAGFEHVAWRVLNARQFGLPHERRRIFIVASQNGDIVKTLLRDVPNANESPQEEPNVAGFYWTAGLHGINFSAGYSPTLKVGSALSIPSPPAVFYHNVVRAISVDEAIALQGFPRSPFEGLSAKAVYRMMGNAVALPVGKFVAGSLKARRSQMRGRLVPMCLEPTLFGDIPWPTSWPRAGLKSGNDYFEYFDPVADVPLATSLEDFVDLESGARLSSRAARGLLTRLNRSGKACPPELRLALSDLAHAAV